MLSRKYLEKRLARTIDRYNQPRNQNGCAHCRLKDLIIARLTLQLRLTPKLARDNARRRVKELEDRIVTDRDRELDRQATDKEYQISYENLSSRVFSQR
jgi:hypothetical protein